MLILYAKINNLPANNHDKNEMLENVHEVILSSSIVYRQTYLSLIFNLLHIVIVVANIPPQWVAQS
jgi:hypothetical protein